MTERVLDTQMALSHDPFMSSSMGNLAILGCCRPDKLRRPEQVLLIDDKNVLL